MVALYRLVELDSGSVKIDGVDISALDLETLRRSISIIPQEAVSVIRSSASPDHLRSHLADSGPLWVPQEQASTFLAYIIISCLVPGTVRSNLDPFGEHDDAILWDALKRAHLISNEKEKSPASALHANRFALDATIDDDGSNLSVGEVCICFLYSRVLCYHAPQRSLISLARALVRKSKILVLDEATGK